MRGCKRRKRPAGAATAPSGESIGAKGHPPWIGGGFYRDLTPMAPSPRQLRSRRCEPSTLGGLRPLEAPLTAVHFEPLTAHREPSRRSWFETVDVTSAYA